MQNNPHERLKVVLNYFRHDADTITDLRISQALFEARINDGVFSNETITRLVNNLRQEPNGKELVDQIILAAGSEGGEA